MSRYIPMPAYYDAMPVDISFVFADEKPAGKRGFVHAEGDDLRFEDGTLAKFWGVNFNGGACFPDKDYSPKVARRLAQAGCNIVRFHQLDAEWDTPNIFSWSKGKRVTTTRQLDPKSMDALDYLIFCLKEEGIYCYLDMITYRKFKEGDGVVAHEQLGDSAKPWIYTNQRLIELQKEFATQIWTHVNPYTGLAYKDDPVFVLTEITNECDLFSKANSDVGYYSQEFLQQFQVWLKEHNLEYDWVNNDIFTKNNTDAIVLNFKSEVQRKFYREMADHMRAIGVKIPITGTNWVKSFGNVKSHLEMDFTDAHSYYYDWSWSNNERICKNRSITSSPTVFPGMAPMKLTGKPFFVSEWDMPWPNSYRAEGPIYYAAVGALQNWSGFTIHTYAYSTRLQEMKILGREQSTPVAGVPYREGIFSVWNDPAKFGLFYHAALMLRRCDITPATKQVAVDCSDITNTSFEAWKGLLEQHRCGTVFDNQLPEGYDELVTSTQTYLHPKAGFIRSDHGQMWRDLNKEYGVIDSPRTKVVYGRLGNTHHRRKDNTGIVLDGMEVSGITDFGVIAMSSLNNDPIEKSDNILLSAIGRARNTDAIFDGEKMLDAGKPPIMAEVIEADIAIRTEHGNKLKVWGVNAEGFYAGNLSTTYEDGILRFHIGDSKNPACYYLIVKE